MRSRRRRRRRRAPHAPGASCPWAPAGRLRVRASPATRRGPRARRLPWRSFHAATPFVGARCRPRTPRGALRPRAAPCTRQRSPAPAQSAAARRWSARGRAASAARRRRVARRPRGATHVAPRPCGPGPRGTGLCRCAHRRPPSAAMRPCAPLRAGRAEARCAAPPGSCAAPRGTHVHVAGHTRGRAVPPGSSARAKAARQRGAWRVHCRPSRAQTRHVPAASWGAVGSGSARGSVPPPPVGSSAALARARPATGTARRTAPALALHGRRSGGRQPAAQTAARSPRGDAQAK